MSASYYERTDITHLDGSRIFQSGADREGENEVALLIEALWKCRIVRFGMLSPIDWFAERHGRVVGVLELKCRQHTTDQYPTVFLNVRKWLALSMGSMGLVCPAIFVVRFTNEVRWIGLTSIDTYNQRVAGCARIVKSRSDIEPVIEVDVDSMNILRVIE